jgi:dihydroorotate dehydrogenase (fumarate)
MPSLFEEQVQQAPEMPQAPKEAPQSFICSLSYFRELAEYNKGPDHCLRHLEAAKKKAKMPLIGSLNATRMGPWLDYARRIQEAGADALELNLYLLVADLQTTAQQVEDRYLEIVAAVRAAVTIPLAVKLSPFFTSLPHLALRLAEARVDGLVLFNRFLQPEIDLDSLQATPHLSLSNPDELRLPLRWIAILYGHLPLSLAATSGIHSAPDVM